MMPSDGLRYHAEAGRTTYAAPLPPPATGISSARWPSHFMPPHAATEASLSLPMKRALVAARLQQQQAHILRQAAIEAPLPDKGKVYDQDPVDLRGIPAIGRGVSGAIPDTQPERAIEKLMREPREGYHRRGTRWIG